LPRIAMCPERKAIGEWLFPKQDECGQNDKSPFHEFCYEQDVLCQVCHLCVTGRNILSASRWEARRANHPRSSYPRRWRTQVRCLQNALYSLDNVTC
jgi:hypothetical protein